MIGIIVLVVSLVVGAAVVALVFRFWKGLEAALPASAPSSEDPSEDAHDLETSLAQPPEEQPEEYFEPACYMHAHLLGSELEEPLSPRQRRFSLKAHSTAPLVDMREFLSELLIVLFANLYADGYVDLERKECEPLFPLVGPSREWDVFVERKQPLPQSSLTRYLEQVFDEFDKRRKRTPELEFTLGELLEFGLQRMVKARGWFGRKGLYFDLVNTLRDSAEVRGLLHLPPQSKALIKLKQEQPEAVAAFEDLAAAEKEALAAIQVAEQLKEDDPDLYEGLRLVVAETLYTLKAMEPDPDSII